MSKHLTFDILIDKINKTIIVSREFDAELDLVWDAFTTRELLDQWWAPKPWKAQTKTMNFKEGGKWFYAMAGPIGVAHWVTTNYIVIKPDKKFVSLDAFTDEDGIVNKQMPQSKREINFIDKGQQTLVEIKTIYDDVGDVDVIINTGFREGITGSLENLDALLARLKE
ncbi:MAG TPA: SRPBCC domain-containing protein [Bacteroidia bacterium]|nr:SRPBCC domain-containing protein [Bacteroidia bacterium]